MKDQFLHTRFFVEIGITIAALLIVYVAARVYNKNAEARDVKVDYFRIPTNNALVVLGLLVPLIVALTAYLYLNNPQGRYTSLLTSIVVLFAVLVIIIWETFALLKKAKDDDKINIAPKQSLTLIVATGWMYTLLLVGLAYFAFFFLFEFSLLPGDVKSAPAGAPAVQILKALPRIDQSRDEILKSWGNPAAEDASGRILIYDSVSSSIRLTFDAGDKLMEIDDKRK